MYVIKIFDNNVYFCVLLRIITIPNSLVGFKAKTYLYFMLLRFTVIHFLRYEQHTLKVVTNFRFKAFPFCDFFIFSFFWIFSKMVYSIITRVSLFAFAVSAGMIACLVALFLSRLYFLSLLMQYREKKLPTKYALKKDEYYILHSS